jgi:hypothetical protein
LPPRRQIRDPYSYQRGDLIASPKDGGAVSDPKLGFLFAYGAIDTSFLIFGAQSRIFANTRSRLALERGATKSNYNDSRGIT